MKYFAIVVFFAVIFAYAQKDIPLAEIARVKAEIESLNKQPDKPGSVEKYIKIGKLYSQINDADNAQASFEKALSIDPKNETAHFMLALIFEKKKMIEKAIYHWQRCLEYSANPSIKGIAAKHISYLSRK